jgi:hypothetical protein
MTIEFRKSQGMPDIEEHSHAAKAKRVIVGAMPFLFNDNGRNIPPTVQAISGSSASIPLEADKLYRIISTVDCYIAISNDSALAATTSDCLLPAKEAMVISTVGNGATALAVIGTSGVLQVMEIG